jgi:hypothetical protein
MIGADGSFLLTLSITAPGTSNCTTSSHPPFTHQIIVAYLWSSLNSRQVSQYRAEAGQLLVSNISLAQREWHLPKSLLDAANVILHPVSLCDLFLTNGNSAPSNSHNGDVINIVLIKVDL